MHYPLCALSQYSVPDRNKRSCFLDPDTESDAAVHDNVMYEMQLSKGSVKYGHLPYYY
jgi:hypothetical protein